MASIDTLAEELGKLTVLEVSELVKKLEADWGVSAAVQAVAAPAGGGGAAAEAAPAAEEKSEFTVFLASFGEKKIDVIKEVRAVVPGLGLADAKKLVESAPINVVENLPKDQAEEVKKKLEAAGAKVELK